MANMKLENKTISAGILGPTSYDFLRGMPTDDPKISIYLLGNNEEGKESEFSLWNVETLDDESNFDIWPYKGEDYEVLKQQLMDDYIENWSLDNYSDIEEEEKFNNEEEIKMEQNKEILTNIYEEIGDFLDKAIEKMEKKDYTEAIEAFEKALALATKHLPNDPEKIEELRNIVNRAKSIAEKEAEAAANEGI
jgi:tetratricopeptide (TPR) repeat protein